MACLANHNPNPNPSPITLTLNPNPKAYKTSHTAYMANRVYGHFD